MHSIDTRKASASGVCSPVSLLAAVDMLYIPNPLWARKIFVSEPSKRLTVAMLCPAHFSGPSIGNLTRAELTRLMGPDPNGMVIRF